MSVVPDPSERWATTMSAFGIVTVLFSSAIFGSFQRVILPR